MDRPVIHLSVDMHGVSIIGSQSGRCKPGDRPQHGQHNRAVLNSDLFRFVTDRRDKGSDVMI